MYAEKIIFLYYRRFGYTMRLNYFFSFFLFCLLYSTLSFAQQPTTPPVKKKDVFYVLETDSIPEVDMGADTVNSYLRKKGKNRKKKGKKKTFYGLKTRRGFTRHGDGERVTVELFFTLKKYREPNAFVPEIYVYDFVDGKIKKVSKIDEEKRKQYRILHGPYTRLYNGEVVEEGVFYVGTKNARWEKYDKKNILLGKTKYFRGWPKEAKIEYFDNARKRPKEVIPYAYGVKEGDYYLFSEKGHIKLKGQYENYRRIGTWVEYFDNSDKRQREIVYGENGYDEEKQPIVMKEWNERGNLIIVDGKPVEAGTIEEDPIKKRLQRKKVTKPGK
jgi:antitoxin component YwqK of YwqJK toxin-antitoxin module